MTANSALPLSAAMALVPVMIEYPNRLMVGYKYTVYTPVVVAPIAVAWGTCIEHVQSDGIGDPIIGRVALPRGGRAKAICTQLLPEF
jgi:hypothetical protein